MNSPELIPHLFRTEYSRIVAVLCKHYGFDFISPAEDIASETFLAAMQSWPYHGLPENPTAWLYTVAKNKAVNLHLRKKNYDKKIVRELTDLTDKDVSINISDDNINDSQLQMIFAICHPAIPKESQIALALRILCGFGIDEIATAFLTTKETINKRLFRAKDKLRTEKVNLSFPEPHLVRERLDAVLITLYLLFSEGYYSENHENLIREELCFEAIRLVEILVTMPQTDLPSTHALLALMYFHTSRFKARTNTSGDIILYEDQDEQQWDTLLIAKGAKHLHQAARGKQITRFHLEASIAFWHTQKEDTIEKWENVLNLYNHLLMLEYSPIAALNRTFALSKVKGIDQAISEAEKLALTNNHFYFVLLGELHKTKDPTKAKVFFEQALQIASTHRDKKIIEAKINNLS